ncbi:MAG: DUF4142 domain-containing protein [Pseudomonadota bacterium]|nr:DUF4142 domain-containing protein [Pseudomonadota bacterium]
MAQQQGDAGSSDATMSPLWPPASPRTAEEFNMTVIGPAEFSLATSQLGVQRATNRRAKQFAGFELTEAIAVTSVLKDLGTPVPDLSANAQAALDRVQAAADGADFDQAYIAVQVDNHVFLRTITEAYLSSPPVSSDMMEMQGRHLATLALATFTEHVILTTEILHRLTA